MDPMTNLQSLRALMEEALRDVTVSESGVIGYPTNRAHLSVSFLAKHGPRLLSIAEAYANAPIVHDVTGRHGFIGHHVRIVPCDAGGEPTTGGRGE